tara:strand:- start:440 stop:1252 length:813 start_codon:yes stop_codon:yes gene_type:complete
MTVITPYNYVDGNVLDPDGHNDNVYSRQAGRGIQSEANGGLNSFKADFAVKKEHVWPEEAVRIRQDSALETIDIFSDAHADSGTAKYRVVAGCAVKVYVPYAATLALWEWSVFISQARFFVHLQDQVFSPKDDGSVAVAAVTSEPNIIIRARLTDSAGTVTNLPHSKRLLAQTIGFDDKSPSGSLPDSYEDRAALHFGMHHLQESVAAGWHELSLTAHQEFVTHEVDDDSRELFQAELARSRGQTTVNRDHVFYQRASFGIRNARVLTLL